MKNIIRIVFIGIILASMCIGCAGVNKSPKEQKTVYERIKQWPKETYSKVVSKLPKKQKAGYVHTVRWPGETFSIIAKWYTGNIDNWEALVKANKRLDPKHLSIGNKILIPEDILTTKETMPKSFVDSFTSKEEELKVFGPKE